MSKLLLGTLIALFCINSYADDLKVADDFESGDLVSADTFNQIFDTIEKINRTVVDADLVGVWKCSAIHASSNNWNGWTNQGLVYELTDAQVNFTASSSNTSLESAFSFSTSSPTPFWRSNDGTAADTGTYQLYNGLLIMKRDAAEEEEDSHGDEHSSNNVRLLDWQVNVVSSSRFTLYKAGTGGGQPNYVVCDSAEAVPASPTSPSVAIDSTNKRLTLTWTDSSKDETGFKVYRKLSSETEAKLIATQTAATYSDTDLTEGQTAYYQVVAYNDNGESAKSKTVSAIADFTPPTVLSVTPAVGQTVSGAGSIQIEVNFSESISTQYRAGATGELFSYSINGTNYTNNLVGVAVAASSIGFPTLPLIEYKTGSTYEVRIGKDYVYDAAGLEMESDYVWSFTTP